METRDVIRDDRALPRRDTDMFNIRQSARALYHSTLHHKTLALAVCALTLALATLYYFVWPPTFKAKATLMAEQDADLARDSFYFTWNTFRKDNPRTEVELITSASVLGEVIAREKLTYDDVYHPPLSHLAYLWEKSTVGKWYRSVKYWLVPPPSDVLTPDELDVARTINDMAAGIAVSTVGESNVGQLTMKGPSRRVAKIANTLIDVYLVQRNERHDSEASKALTVLQEQVARAEQELKKAEDQRLAYAESQGLILEFEKESRNVIQLAETETNLATNRMKMSTLDAMLREIDRQLDGEPVSRTSATEFELNTLRENLKLKRAEFQVVLIQAEQRYRQDSPEVREIKDNIAKLDTMVAGSSERIERMVTEQLNPMRQELLSKRNALWTDLEGLRAGTVALEETAQSLRERLERVPAMQSWILRLSREVIASQAKYLELRVKLSQAEVSLATGRLAMPSLRVVDYATPPPHRSWPLAKILLPAALLFGLFLGVVAAQVKSLIVGRVRWMDVETRHAPLPLYASITIPRRRWPVTIVRSDGAATGKTPTGCGSR